ncbi:MAG: hypothetical protein V5A44_07290 [Haloarculaceae archaeon]
MTLLIWLAANARSVLVVAPFSVGAWGSYMCAHYVVEGEFIDRGGAETDTPDGEPGDTPGGDATGNGIQLPSSSARWSLAFVGLASMLLTFPTGIVAVGTNEFVLMLASSTLFVGGYVVGHVGFTGKPL